jgi:hypothetical protein
MEGPFRQKFLIGNTEEEAVLRVLVFDREMTGAARCTALRRV